MDSNLKKKILILIEQFYKEKKINYQRKYSELKPNHSLEDLTKLRKRYSLNYKDIKEF